MPVKFATLNLFQYLLPGSFWYERESRNQNSDEDWAAKEIWLKAIIDQMDADVIGFQEIFSVEPLTALLTELGYPHFARVAEPARSEDDPDVFVRPVVAIASRHPFIEPPVALNVDEALIKETVLEDGFKPRRDIVRGRIDLPDLGPTLVICCHFKSQGAFVDKDEVAALADWRARFREHLRQRAIKDADQIMRRSAEAVAVYLAAMEEIDKDRQAPIVVLGDLNDEPDSPTLRMITQGEWINTIAGRRRSDLENEEKAWQYSWQLFDAFELAPQQSPSPRQPTHKGSYFYPPSTLDYVIVSNGLNALNPKAAWTVKTVGVLADHLIEDSDSRETSDHAAVVATLDRLLPTDGA
ncbi:MAG: endonuclease/exonuclease/phosphatase family protein [Pseudomonadota bacterium]